MPSGAATAVGCHGEGTIAAEEFIAGIEHALMELMERNPLLAKANVEIERVSCKSGDSVSNVVTTDDDLIENGRLPLS